mgnify:CR=1 FL=1
MDALVDRPDFKYILALQESAAVADERLAGDQRSGPRSSLPQAHDRQAADNPAMMTADSTTRVVT